MLQKETLCSIQALPEWNFAFENKLNHVIHYDVIKLFRNGKHWKTLMEKLIEFHKTYWLWFGEGRNYREH